MVEQVEKRTHKIILIGDPAVGKTSIRKRYLGEGFTSDHKSTIGFDLSFIDVNGCSVQIWDLAGVKNYYYIRSQYYLKTDAAIFVFDISRPDTLSSFLDWMNEIYGVLNRQIPVFIVGNKEDLRSSFDKIVDDIDLLENIKTWENILDTKISYLFSSAKTGLNIDSIFSSLFLQLEITNSYDYERQIY